MKTGLGGRVLFLAAALAAAALHGCGGGGSSSNGTVIGGGGGGTGGGTAPGTGGGTTTTATVSGVAASGAPLSGNAFLKDSAGGPEVTTTINALTGAFSFDVTGRTPPFILRTGTLYSLSGSSGTANINPFSTLMVADMGGFRNMSTLNSFYNQPSGSTLRSMFANISTSRRHLDDTMAPLLNTYGVPSNVDPIGGTFTTGQGGLDRLFDDLKMSIDPTGTVTLLYVNGSQVFTGPMENLTAGTLFAGNILTPGTNAISSLRISPAVAKLQPGDSQRFTANLAANWAVLTPNGGSITSDGVYTAPNTPGIFLIVATSTAGGTQKATATIMVGIRGMTM